MSMPQLLVTTVMLPLAGALALILLAPRLDHRRAREIALATTFISLALSLVLFAAFDPATTVPQFAFQRGEAHGIPWIGLPTGTGIRFALGLDGVSLLLFALTPVLMITAIFSSWESVKERAPTHYALLLAEQTALMGLFASLDIVLFYIFFEFTLIPLFFLIGLYGGPERRRASITFFLYTLAGSLLTLLGAVALVVVYYQHSAGNILTFSIPDLTDGLAHLHLSWADWGQATSLSSPQVWIFLLLLAGFAIKVPLFPVHTWLPLAHVEAPTAGSILLAGVLLKVGSYGLYRFNLGMAPLGAAYLFPWLAAIAVAGIIYGALTALAQTDIKRLVAYSSVSHMGFVALGLFAMNPTGLEGAVIQMVNHGLTTGALFACVGVIYERYHTREMSEMSGLWDRLPLLAFFLILSSLGSAAVPGLNGFVGEFPILAGMFARSRTSTVLSTIGMILGAYYLLRMLQRVIFGPLREPVGHDDDPHGASHGPALVRPIGWHEIAGLSPLMALIVIIGVYPKPFFDRIHKPVAQVARRIEDAERPAPPAVASLNRPAPTAGRSPAPQDQDRAR